MRIKITLCPRCKEREKAPGGSYCLRCKSARQAEYYRKPGVSERYIRNEKAKRDARKAAP